ncbi:hypothetical protein Trydic_g2102 [Trypoxylus dichotomus]
MCRVEKGTSKTEDNQENRISFLFGIFFLLYICLAIGVSYLIENWMPTALTIEDELGNPDRFIGERAQNYLKGLTDLGPRITGSYQNEILAVNYLEATIQDIINNKSNAQNIEYDINVVTGSYYLGYKPYGSINAYANLQNVVVKVNAVNASANSILINSHFDTVVTSPGGSDAGINCAVMLEVIRKLSQSAEPPTNNLIFLFNGGEEANILASHGFITQHKWAPTVKVVVNLEATGADGKEILFQSGPDRAWLMKYYSKVPYPFGHVAGEEIFKSNIISSDTDFRIFRDFGGVIGYDFAYFKDGYRYHTKYDGFDNIKKERYQRTGDNILRLVRELANAPEVVNPEENSGGSVYFDVLGLFMIYYEERTEIIINVLDEISLVEDVLTQIHLIRIIWTAVLICGFGLGIKSVYLFMIPVLFNTLVLTIIHIFKLYYYKYIWIFVYLLGTFIPTVLVGAVAYHVLSLFIPICGRFGTSLNPEFMIGAFTVTATILITCYYMPLFSLLSKQIFILIFLGALFFGTIIVILTPIGFPYSADKDRLAPQRFPVFHTQRVYHDENGNIFQNDSGFYFRHMDYNSPRSIKNHVLGMGNVTSLQKDCEVALFCGLPVSYSRDLEELESNSWIPSEAPIFTDALPTLTLNSIVLVSDEIKRYHFTITGPNSMDIYLSPKEGINFLNISLNTFLPTEQPLWNNRPTLYILYANGKENVPLHFFVDFELPENWSKSIVDIAVVGKYNQADNNIYTKEFQDFMNSFPEWTVITTIALAYYESWVY